MDAALPPLDLAAAAAARHRWDERAKPPGSLGRLEDVAVRLAGITGRCPPKVPDAPVVVVFAGDHGVVADGASAWPSEVTAAMVSTMAEGRAAVNAFATTVGAAVRVVDAGVAADTSGLDGVEQRKVRAGTASLLRGPAMSTEEARATFTMGGRCADEAADSGADLLVAGDMGIGNTTPSSCLIAALCGVAPADAVGPGAGLDEAAIATKVGIVEAAVARIDGVDDPIELLAEVGGLEISAMAGFYAAAAARNVPVIVDGVISLAALLVAEACRAGTAERCLAGHRSTEPGASIVLDELGLEPMLDLDLRLGEGTGAVLAIPLVQAAARALRDMADLPT